MLKKLFIAVLACILLFSFCACGSKEGEESSVIVDPNDPFTGEWLMVTEDGIYELLCFYGNGKGYQQALDIYLDIGYTYDDTKLTFDVYVEDPPLKRVYEYRIEEMDLFLKNIETGTEKHYVKQATK